MGGQSEETEVRKEAQEALELKELVAREEGC